MGSPRGNLRASKPRGYSLCICIYVKRFSTGTFSPRICYMLRAGVASALLLDLQWLCHRKGTESTKDWVRMTRLIFSDWRKAFRPSTLNSGYVTLTTKGFQFNRGRDTQPQKQTTPTSVYRNLQQKAAKSLELKAPAVRQPRGRSKISSFQSAETAPRKNLRFFLDSCEETSPI